MKKNEHRDFEFLTPENSYIVNILDKEQEFKECIKHEKEIKLRTIESIKSSVLLVVTLFLFTYLLFINSISEFTYLGLMVALGIYLVITKKYD
jgi:hypothetical protein